MKCQFTKMITPQGCVNHYKVKFECQKESIVVKNGKNLCRQHGNIGTYVIREGDIGEFVFRCNTEKELREEFALDKYEKPKYRMQRVKKSRRRDIF